MPLPNINVPQVFIRLVSIYGLWKIWFSLSRSLANTTAILVTIPFVTFDEDRDADEADLIDDYDPNEPSVEPGKKNRLMLLPNMTQFIKIPYIHYHV